MSRLLFIRDVVDKERGSSVRQSWMSREIDTVQPSRRCKKVIEGRE
jgi:hypothetical protein